MQRRSLILFVILNILISLAVAFGVISLLQGGSPTQSPVQLITVELIITATRDPNATRELRIITATPQPGSIQTLVSEATQGTQAVAVLPTGILPNGSPGTPLATTDVIALGNSPDAAGTATALPEFCIPHVLKEGDTPFAVAEIYGADPFQLLAINGLDETAATFLQIGDVLIVPLPGCPLQAGDAAGGGAAGASATPTQETASATPTTGPSATPPPTIRPTVTLAPTASNAVMRIVEVLNAGDVTAESVAIRNTGAIVDIANWTLSDADGNTYTFAQQRLFTNAQITLYSRVGTNSPVALYWGRDQAVYQPGDVITLRDAAGAVQATFRVP
jgi:hypothetical protein